MQREDDFIARHSATYGTINARIDNHGQNVNILSMIVHKTIFLPVPLAGSVRVSYEDDSVQTFSDDELKLARA